jgi:sterol desaturase/sphingolipid hydroxylase (fatty acid hydroxylase superfamily)
MYNSFLTCHLTPCPCLKKLHCCFSLMVICIMTQLRHAFVFALLMIKKLYLMNERLYQSLIRAKTLGGVSESGLLFLLLSLTRSAGADNFGISAHWNNAVHSLSSLFPIALKIWLQFLCLIVLYGFHCCFWCSFSHFIPLFDRHCGFCCAFPFTSCQIAASPDYQSVVS